MRKTLEFLIREGDSLPPQVDEGMIAVIEGRTDVGKTRAVNQDQFVVASLERTIQVEQCALAPSAGLRTTESPSGRLMMVADGMGGHEHGEVASAVVVDAMMQYAFSLMPWLRAAGQEPDAEDALADGLTRAVENAQQRMEQVAKRKGFSGRMGSTLTLAYVAWPKLYVSHVGDCRAYIMRKDALYRLTRDHNMADDLVRGKVLDEEQARRSRYASMLTNCLSTSGSSLEVELHRMDLERGDRLLLCTDGLYGELSDEEISDRLRHVKAHPDVGNCLDSLVRRANENGGSDNITGVLALF